MSTIKTLKLFTMFILLAAVSVPAQSDDTHYLLPVPKSVQLTGNGFLVDSNFTVSVKGYPHERLYLYATRTLRRLSGRTGLFFKQDFITKETNISNPSLLIEVDAPAEIKLHEDESYTLNVSAGSIKLSAKTDIGAMRGLETLLQLLTVNNGYYYLRGAEIEDAPRFPWRGLMIDAGRHFMPVDMVKRNLDGMAAVKLNVMHWHLSEDQGFPIESKTFPELHQLGSDGEYYTHAQVKDIIAYAADRGIRVVPEFDLPGHSTSWLVAFPELASAPGPYTIERKWGIFDPTFDPTNPKTYEFFDKFFAEMSQLFPDEFMHIGGDENNGKQWNNNPDIQKFMKENNLPDNHSLQAYFNSKLLTILTKNGKRMVGWEEIMHPEMPKTIVVQSWRGAKSLQEAVENGYQVMLSKGYYIDLNFSTGSHYFVDPAAEELSLTPEQEKLIIGGEATMWSEYVTHETVDSRIWPRTAAIAERFWSPKNIKDLNDLYRRLKVVSFRLEELGLQHIKNRNMMMRRLTNNNDIAPVQTFLGTVEPVKEYTRGQQRDDYTSYSPYTRVVDASIADVEPARNFAFTVDRFLTAAEQGNTAALKGADAAQLDSALTHWAANHQLLKPIIQQSPILKEIEPLSAQLAEVSKLGLHALANIKNNKMADPSWESAALKTLSEAKHPRGQVELMIIAPVQRLVEYSAKSTSTKN